MTEILAPCGDFAALAGVIDGGADAVYLGLKQFSARASAGNFSEEELAAGVRYARCFGVKVYAALNTLLTDRELAAAKPLVRACAEAGVDGVIVQDLGLFSALKASCDLPLHLSTQGGVYNAEGARAAGELGFSRVILSREAEAGEIRAVKALGPEVEVFAHGALCTGFSGNCYLSSFLSSTSGNRGRCLQPCRLAYRCTDAAGKKLAEGALLSSRDQCTLPVLDRILREGPDSLKIEGRLKSPEYGSEAARVYRRAVGILEGEREGGIPAAEPSGGPAGTAGRREPGRGSNPVWYTEEDLNRLKILFNRGGFCEGLSRGREGVICSGAPAHWGLPVGRVEGVRGRTLYAKLDRTLRKGDCCKVFRGGTELGTAVLTEKNRFSVKTDAEIRPGDALHLFSEQALLEEIGSRKRRLTLSVSLRAVAGEPISAKLTCGEQSAELTGEVVQFAKSCPLSEAQFRACFAVRSEPDYPFELGTFDCVCRDAFLPKSALNAFRRRCQALLYEKLTERPRRPFDGEAFDRAVGFGTGEGTGGKTAGRISRTSGKTGTGLRIAVFSAFGERERKVSEGFDRLVFAPKDYFNSRFEAEWRAIRETGKPCYLDLPLFLYRKDFARFEAFSREYEGLYVHNLAGVGLAKRLDRACLLSPDLNVFNTAAAALFHAYLDCDIVLSEELHGAQAAEILEVFPGDFVLAAGRQNLMQLNHCPVRENLSGSCETCGWREGLVYRNDYGQEFPLDRVRAGNCYFCLQNGAVTFKCMEDSEVNTLWDFSSAPELLEGFDPRSGTCKRPSRFTAGHWKRKVL